MSSEFPTWFPFFSEGSHKVRGEIKATLNVIRPHKFPTLFWSN